MEEISLNLSLVLILILNISNPDVVKGEEHHATQIRVEIVTGVTGSYATAKTLMKTDDLDQLDGETCYDLYRKMKEILGDIGFGEAVWPHQIPDDWELIGREMRENGEVRWIQAGNRRYRIASYRIAANGGVTKKRTRSDEKRNDKQHGKKWIELGQNEARVI